jgi:DNA-binding transcriptional ArsR family regulator
MKRRVAPRVGRPTKAEVAAREGAEGRVIRALGHRTRRQILLLLSYGERPVHELADHFDVSRPMVSKHLRVLVEAGLIEGRPVGRERLYRVLDRPDAKTALDLARADAAHHAQVDRLRARLTRKPPGKD